MRPHASPQCLGQHRRSQRSTHHLGLCAHSFSVVRALSAHYDKVRLPDPAYLPHKRPCLLQLPLAMKTVQIFCAGRQPLQKDRMPNVEETMCRATGTAESSNDSGLSPAFYPRAAARNQPLAHNRDIDSASHSRCGLCFHVRGWLIKTSINKALLNPNGLGQKNGY